MAVLFPFEYEFYQRENIPSCLVRHPILSEIEKFQRRSESNTTPTKIGLLPGSRKNEIRRLLPVMAAAAESLYAENPDLNFVIPIAPGHDKKDFQKLVPQHLPVHFSTQNFYQTIANCSAIVVASGTRYPTSRFDGQGDGNRI